MPRFSDSGFTISYTCRGAGEPLVLLHGNTGASRMLEPEIEYYSRTFQVIAIDLIGHGESGRLPEFPADFWYTNACLALALCARLHCPPLHILGTSGGAIVALNMALEAPAMARSVVADSFPGQRTSPLQAEGIARQRQAAKTGPGLAFWTAMHGAGWEQVVDADTRMLLHFARSGGSFFRRDLASLRCPVLVTASLEDELIADVRDTVRELSLLIPFLECELFESGHHPAMLSNTEAFRSRAVRFFRGLAE
jgi:pimeloyl-ACP methyl ester carboxylesterase